MSYFGNVNIASPIPLPINVVSGGGSVSFSETLTDAFGRLRVSSPTTMFSSQSEYDKSPLFWEEAVVGTGVATHLPNESSIQLSTGGAANGASCVRQSREYIRYQPGKSQLAFFTFVFGTQVANVVREVGLYDASNGLFLRDTGTDYAFVRRTSVTGSPVENVIARASWDDPMNGNGASGVNLDFTKSQILWIDIEWLGVGLVRFGFIVDGIFYVAYKSKHTNVLSTVYMGTANLPARYQISNSAAVAGANTMLQICTSVSSEGGFDVDVAYSFGVAQAAPRTINTTGFPQLAIRPRTTFGGKAFRGVVVLDSVAVTCSADAAWVLYYGATVTGGAWSNRDTNNSGVEFNSTATSYSGGIPVLTGLLAGTNQTQIASTTSVRSRFPLSVSIDGSTSIAMLLVLFATTGTPTARGALNWRELR